MCLSLIWKVAKCTRCNCTILKHMIIFLIFFKCLYIIYLRNGRFYFSVTSSCFLHFFIFSFIIICINRILSFSCSSIDNAAFFFPLVVLRHHCTWHLLTFRVFSPRSGTYSYLLIYCIVYIYVHNVCNSKQWNMHSSALSGEYSIYIVSVSLARLFIFRIEKWHMVGWFLQQSASWLKICLCIASNLFYITVLREGMRVLKGSYYCIWTSTHFIWGW